MKSVKIGKFHILELIISGFMDFCYGGWGQYKTAMYIIFNVITSIH